MRDFFISLAALSLLLGVGCGQIANWQIDRSRSTILTVSAAISLQDVMEEIKPIYQVENPHVKIIYNFASSGSLQRQIEQGAPVDVFFSAAEDKMTALQQQDLLITETLQDVLTNRIVLIAPINSSKINNFTDLTKENVTAIALGEPASVPAGKYAQEVLAHFQIADEVNAKAVYGKDVRQVLNYVATGNVDAGIVYRTDARVSSKVKVIAIAPKTSHAPIVYSVAAIEDSHNPEAARELVEFLKTPQAQAVFAEHGFR